MIILVSSSKKQLRALLRVLEFWVLIVKDCSKLISMLRLQGCLYSDCYYTEKSNLLGNSSLELFDAILFAVPSFRHKKQAESIIPKRRSPNQSYVMVRILRYTLAEVSCFYGQNSDYLYS